MKKPSKIIAALTVLPLTAALSACSTSGTDTAEQTCAKVSNWSSSMFSKQSVSIYDFKTRLKHVGETAKAMGDESKDSTLNSALNKLGDSYIAASKNVKDDAKLKGLDPFSSSQKADIRKAQEDIQSKCATMGS